MSEGTNTPNGDSKLYENNRDIGKFKVGFMVLEEKDRTTSNNYMPGSNTVIGSTDIGELSNDTILMVGSINLNAVVFNDKDKYESTKKAIIEKAEKSRLEKESDTERNNDTLR